MEMQDLDYEVFYETRKNEADPLGYLSRYPGKQVENNNTTEAILKYTSKQASAVMIEHI